LPAKRYSRGLVVGKFSPLHKGHEYLIQAANARCEHLIVISYTRPEFPSCSRALREKWLGNLVPDATLLCIDASTTEQWRSEGAWNLSMPSNNDPADIHREFTHQLLTQKLKLRVDTVFTSENYGDGFANYLSNHSNGVGVDHVCVDIDRLAYPVSGTSIRTSGNFSLANLSESIMHEFAIQKVCFLGGESTGKSTLSALLADEYGEPLVDEFGRSLWEQKSGDLAPEDLITICQTQTRNEDIAQQKADKHIFCDTSPLTTLCYSEALFNSRPALLEAFAERPYHHIFLCEPDFPLQQDGTRKEEDFRLWQHNWYLQQLSLRKLPFTRLTGSIEERITQVRSTIESLRRFD
jgi:HTH-type transcriptional repressor of NAD biosynthesis genes